MQLIIVRHGETEENVKKIIQGQMEGKLTKNGVNQAKITAKRLRNKKIDIIISSDLKRSADTANEIAKYHKVPIIYSKALRERKMGIFEGKHQHIVDNHIKRIGSHKAKFRAKGGENYSDVKRRVGRFLNRLSKRYQNKIILISTHGIVIRCILSLYLNIPLKETADLFIKNAGFIILEVNGKKIEKLEEDIFLSTSNVGQS